MKILRYYIFSKSPWVLLSLAVKWCSKVPSVPAMVALKSARVFCPLGMRPQRETDILTCLKLYSKWCLVAGLTKINEKVYFLFGEDLNLLFQCPNSRWYKQVLVCGGCGWSALISSDGCMVVFALEFVNLQLRWSASKASTGLGIRLKIYSALCKARAQIHSSPLTRR